MRDKILCYADVSNLFFRHKKINWVALLDFIKERFDIVRATTYVSLDKSNQNQTSFLTYLSSSGWRVNAIDLAKNSNVDSRLMVDVANEARDLPCDWICLIAMDSDYEYLLDDLRRRGKRIMVIGVKDNTSLALRIGTDELAYIEDIPDVIPNK